MRITFAAVLDPRIYRMSLILPALALVVLAFSLTGQPRALSSSLAPAAFSGRNVSASMLTLEHNHSAAYVAHQLGSGVDGFSVHTDTFHAQTSAGRRTLRNVIATRPGTASVGGPLVIVAPRDVPGLAGVSGTATLLELGRVLGGETLDRTIVLASISGSPGAVGARRLGSSLGGSVDAVLVLGDVASSNRRQPIIVPWTAGERIAPARLRNTVSAALQRESGIRAGSPDLANQLAHLAFPLTLSEQGPFGSRGTPAVSLSLSGELGPARHAPVAGAGRLTAIGRGLLSAITALDRGPAVPAASAYVLFDHEVVPSWAITLFVLALIVPVALTTIDGLARARRRRYPLARSLGAVLAAASPFLAAVAVIVIGGALDALGALPGAPRPGAIAVGGDAITVMAVALLVAIGCAVGARYAFAAVGPPRASRSGRESRTPDPANPDDGIAAAMLLVLCVVAVLVWLVNPFAAALLVPALHLWLWAIDGDLRLPLPVRIVMIALGAVPTAAVVVFFAHALHFSPGQLPWEAVLLLGGHVVSWVAAIEWSLALGCLGTALGLVVAAARRPEPVAPPVTVRGPLSYAGPGSLGGTKSALRR